MPSVHKSPMTSFLQGGVFNVGTGDPPTLFQSPVKGCNAPSQNTATEGLTKADSQWTPSSFGVSCTPSWGKKKSHFTAICTPAPRSASLEQSQQASLFIYSLKQSNFRLSIFICILYFDTFIEIIFLKTCERPRMEFPVEDLNLSQ